MPSFGCVAEHYRDTALPCSGQWEVQRPLKAGRFVYTARRIQVRTPLHIA